MFHANHRYGGYRKEYYETEGGCGLTVILAMILGVAIDEILVVDGNTGAQISA